MGVLRLGIAHAPRLGCECGFDRETVDVGDAWDALNDGAVARAPSPEKPSRLWKARERQFDEFADVGAVVTIDHALFER